MRSSDDIIGFDSPAEACGLAAGDPDYAGPLVAQALSSLLALIREQLKLDVVFIAEFVDGRRVFRHVSANPGETMCRAGDSHPIEESLCAQVVDGRIPKLVRDLRALRARQPLPDITKPMGTHIGVPVRLPNGRVFGTLCGFAVERCASLSQRDVKRLEVAAQATARLLAQAAGHTDWDLLETA